MRHVSREAVESAVNDTSARLKTVAGRLDFEQTERDVIQILRRHLDKLGQSELAEQVDDFLIGHTKPTEAAS